MFGGATMYLCEKCKHTTVLNHDCGKEVLCHGCGTWYAQRKARESSLSGHSDDGGD